MSHTHTPAPGRPPRLHRLARTLRRALLLLTVGLAAQTATAQERYYFLDKQGFKGYFVVDEATNTARLQSVSNGFAMHRHYLMPEEIAANDEPSVKFPLVGFTDDFELGTDSITIANTVKAIGKDTFRRLGYLFSANPLTYVDLGDGLEEVPDSAFFNCQYLTHVRIGNRVKRIGKYAFGLWIHGSGTMPIETLEMGENVEEIGEGAFMHCRLIETMHIPAATRSINPYAFRYMTALDRIEVDPANAHYQSIDGVLYDKELTTLVRLPGSRASVELPATVTTIGDNAISENQAMTEIRLPDQVTHIGNDAFEWAKLLESVHTGDGVRTIGDRAFYACYSLQSVHFGDAVESLGEGVFTYSDPYFFHIGASISSLDEIPIDHKFTISEDNPYFRLIGGVLYDQAITKSLVAQSEVTEVTVPEGVRTIGRSTFSGCDITAVSLPEGLETIEDYAFSGCQRLTAITLPEGLKNIGACAFRYCMDLSEITLPESLQTMGENVFENCLLTRFTFKGDPAVIDRGALAQSGWGEEVVYDASLVPERTFNIASYTLAITLGESVDSIGKCAFQNCMRLKEIQLPASLTAIGDSAFYGCTELRHIYVPTGEQTSRNDDDSAAPVMQDCTLPASLRYLGEAAFAACHALETIVIPDGIRTIRDETFFYCLALRHVTLPARLESIGYRAFSSCHSLPEIHLPATLKEIGARGFLYNPLLIDVRLPEGLTTLGAGAFGECYGLRTINLPASLESLGESVFRYCTSLRSIVAAPNVPLAFPDYFLDYGASPADITLYVPAGRRTAYAAAEGWKDFGKILELENTYFRRVTAADDVTLGGVYFLVDEANARAAYADGTALAADAVTLGEGEIRNLTGGQVTEIVLEPAGGQAGSYSVRLGGQYLSLTNGSLSLTDEPQAWTVNPAAASPLMQGTAAVVFSKEGTIECTTEAIDAAARFAPTLYRKVGDLAIDTPEGYATFVSGTSYIMPEGMEGATVDGTDGDALQLNFRYTAGTVVPANVPVLLKGTEGTHTYALTTLPGGMPEENLLEGSVMARAVALSDTLRHYELTHDDTEANLGFYVLSAPAPEEGETEGEEVSAANATTLRAEILTDDAGNACFLVEPGKAFLRLPVEGADLADVYLLEKADVTAITSPLAPKADGPAVIYDLTGRRISATSAASLPAGIYIINGQKTLVR